LVALGNAKLMADLGITLGDIEHKADELRSGGATALYLAVDGNPGGVIAISDPIKSTTQAALDSLRNDGIRIVMLTGDNKTTAEAVARKLGIKEVEADVLPQDKNRIVKKLTAEGRIVAMAGDGVNDAPALAEAAVGIAMGTGTEVAIQSAGITLVKGDLAGIARAIVLSHATMRNIRQNLVFACAYNAIGIPIAAGILYPAFGVLLSPIVAALAMSLPRVGPGNGAARVIRNGRRRHRSRALNGPIRFPSSRRLRGNSVTARRPCDLAGRAVTVRLLRAKISVMGSRPEIAPACQRLRILN
jgi:Cu+-exporting ATPase